jgi:hypothetical protein
MASRRQSLVKKPKKNTLSRLRKARVNSKDYLNRTPGSTGHRAQPDTGPMEGNLSRVEKLLEQIKATPEYAAHQKSIAGLAETIAKYHRGFNVQQAKMAK